MTGSQKPLINISEVILLFTLTGILVLVSGFPSC